MQHLLQGLNGVDAPETTKQWPRSKKGLTPIWQ